MAVDDGDLAQAGAAQGGGQGGVAQDGDGGDGGALDEGGAGLRQQHAADDLPVGAAHGLGGLDDAAVHLTEGGLHHAGHVGRRGDDQGDDDGAVAQADAQDEPGHGNHGHHQDNAGDGAEEIDHKAQNLIEPAHRGDAAAVRDMEHHAQRQTQHVGEGGGEGGHVHRLPYALLDEAVGPQLEKHLRHWPSPPPTGHCWC